MGKLSNYLLEGLFLYFFITAENQTLSKLNKLPNFKDDRVKKILYKKKLFKRLSIRSFCQFHRHWLFCIKVHVSLPKHKTQRWTNNWFSKPKKTLSNRIFEKLVAEIECVVKLRITSVILKISFIDEKDHDMLLTSSA